MIKLWINEFERDVILAALDAYKADAQEAEQWVPFVEGIERIYDMIYHAGEENDE